MKPVVGVMPLWDETKDSIWMLPGKKFLWAVQWHPEFSYKADDQSRRIFRAFVESMELVE